MGELKKNINDNSEIKKKCFEIMIHVPDNVW